MLFKLEVIVITFLVCTLIVGVMLKFAYIPFTVYWLMPLVGGMMVGVHGASLKKLLVRSKTAGGGIKAQFIGPCIGLSLGLAFLVAGFVIVGNY